MSILEQRGEILKHLIHFSNASGSRNAESSWLSARIPSRGNTCLLWTWVFIAGGTGNKIMAAFHSVQAVQSFMEQIWQHIGSCNSESYFPLTEPCIWGSCGAGEQGKNNLRIKSICCQIAFAHLGTWVHYVMWKLVSRNSKAFQAWLKVTYNTGSPVFKYEKIELLVCIYEISGELVFKYGISGCSRCLTVVT